MRQVREACRVTRDTRCALSDALWPLTPGFLLENLEQSHIVKFSIEKTDEVTQVPDAHCVTRVA